MIGNSDGTSFFLFQAKWHVHVGQSICLFTYRQVKIVLANIWKHAPITKCVYLKTWWLIWHEFVCVFSELPSFQRRVRKLRGEKQGASGRKHQPSVRDLQIPMKSNQILQPFCHQEGGKEVWHEVWKEVLSVVDKLSWNI